MASGTPEPHTPLGAEDLPRPLAATIAVHSLSGHPAMLGNDAPVTPRGKKGKGKGDSGPAVSVRYRWPRPVDVTKLSAFAGPGEGDDGTGTGTGIGGGGSTANNTARSEASTARPSSSSEKRKKKDKGGADADADADPDTLDVLNDPARGWLWHEAGVAKAVADPADLPPVSAPGDLIAAHVGTAQAVPCDSWMRRACALPFRIELSEATGKKGSEPLGSVDIDLVPALLERAVRVDPAHAIAPAAPADLEGSAPEGEDADPGAGAAGEGPDDEEDPAFLEPVEIPAPTEDDPDRTVTAYWFRVNAPAEPVAAGKDKDRDRDRDGKKSSSKAGADSGGGARATSGAATSMRVLVSVTFHDPDTLEECPLLTEDDAEVANVIEIDPGMIHPLPQALVQGAEEDAFRYTLAARMPVDARLSVSLVLEDGLVDLTVSGGPGGGADADGGDAARDGGDGGGAETLGPRIVWPSAQPPRRLYLGPDAVGALLAHRDADPNDASVAFTVTRHIANPKYAAARDANALRYTGEAHVPLSTLLAPGSNLAEGLYELEPHVQSPEEALAAAEEEAAAAADGKKSGAKKGGKAGGGKAPKLPAGLEALLATEAEAPEEDGRGPYAAAGTALEVRLSTFFPITPREPTPPPGTPTRPSDLIPTRPPLPDVPRSDPDDEFVRRVKAVIRQLAEQYDVLFTGMGDGGGGGGGGGLGSDESNYDPEERRRRLVFELNRDGKYHTFKEQLKLSVRRIVRETMRDHPAAGKDRFHNDLYVHLMKGVHRAMNEYVAAVPKDETAQWMRRHGGDPGPISGPATGAAAAADLDHADERRLKLADEAELFGRRADAQRHHQQRVAERPRDAQRWFDYGAFLSRCGEAVRAQECFREAVAIDPDNILALCAHGCSVLLNRERPAEPGGVPLDGGASADADGGGGGGGGGGDFYPGAADGEEDPALVFIRGAVDVDPQCVDAHVCLALAHRWLRDDTRARASLQDAIALADEERGTYLPVRRAVLGTMSVPDDPSPLVKTASGFLLECGVPALALAALDAHRSLSGDTNPALCARSRALMLSGEPERAADTARRALETDASDPVAWVCLGHAVYACEDADHAYHDKLRARAEEEDAAAAADGGGRRGGGGGGGGGSGGGSSKKGAGGRGKGGDKKGADEGAAPADADPRTTSSHDCYEAAWSMTEPFDLVDPVAWVRLGWLRSESAAAARDPVYGAEAAQVARDAHYRTCEEWPCATAWLGVGAAYLHAHGSDPSLAEEALAEANTLDPRSAPVWGHLALACLAAERTAEARKCLSNALRLGVDDPLLVQRIARAFADNGCSVDARDTLRRSLALGESSQARLDLAEVLVDLGELDEAVPELKRVVDRGDPAVRGPAIQSLCAVLVSMERGAEADRYRQMLGDAGAVTVEF